MNIEPKISREVAEKDISRWLDNKKTSIKRRTENENAIGTLVDAVMYGDLIVKETGELEQALKFPLSEINLTTLTYRPRVALNDFKERTKNVDPRDAEGRLLAYISVLTGQGMGPLGKLDSEDIVIASAVAVFFL